MRLKPSLCPALAVCLLAIAQAGCGSVHVGRESAAEVTFVDGESKESRLAAVGIEAIANNVRTFGLVGIIVPFIPIWHSGEDKNDFKIILTFSPGPTSNLSFDPRQVVLELEQGVLVPVESFIGPIIEDDPYLTIKRENKAGPILLDKKLRIYLTFPVKPTPPGEKFSVVLKGLSRSGQSIEALRLEFQRQLFLGIIYFFLQLNPHNIEPSIDAKWVISR
jgi:hypothetical protein